MSGLKVAKLLHYSPPDSSMESDQKMRQLQARQSL